MSRKPFFSRPRLLEITGLLADFGDLGLVEGRDYKQSFVCLYRIEMQTLAVCGPPPTHVFSLAKIIHFPAEVFILNGFKIRQLHSLQTDKICIRLIKEAQYGSMYWEKSAH